MSPHPQRDTLGTRSGHAPTCQSGYVPHPLNRQGGREPSSVAAGEALSYRNILSAPHRAPRYVTLWHCQTRSHTTAAVMW